MENATLTASSGSFFNHALATKTNPVGFPVSCFVLFFYRIWFYSHLDES